MFCRRCPLVVLALLFPFASATLEASAAETVYVSPSGDDANPGGRDRPLRTIGAGLSRLAPGRTLVLLDGTWKLTREVVVRQRGRAGAWIEIRGERGARPVLDASAVDIPAGEAYPQVRGAVQIEGSSFVRIRNLHVRGSHQAGFNVVTSDHVEIINCSSDGSFASGISAWQGTTSLRILGNTVKGANDRTLSFRPFTGSEAPHEAISIAGTHGFEVAWNHVGPNFKEGIDVKETAAHGVVHHNYCHDHERQGLYVDAWFGVLEDVELRDNVSERNEAGIAVSSEDGPVTRDIRIRRNLVFDNRASGLYFSRWGKDRPRERVVVEHNTFFRNGYGRDGSGDPSYWLSGGCYLHTTQLRDVVIRENVFAANKPFEIGYSRDWGPGGLGKRVRIERNLIHDVNTTSFPFHMTTWAKDWVMTTTGVRAILAEPLFVDVAARDLRPRPGSPASGLGALAVDAPAKPWWKEAFPPEIEP